MLALAFLVSLQAATADTRQLIDAHVRALMRKHDVPGVSVAVIEAGKVAWAKGYGVAELGRAQRVRTGTLFQAASISKPVAALGVLRLVERGSLSLSGDANDKLASFRLRSTRQGQPVTVKQLLSHTAGVAVHGFSGYGHEATVPSLAQVLAGEPPANSPRIRVKSTSAPGPRPFRYSGGGYCVLQQLMLDVSGKSFPALMRGLVLDPLGMKDSSYAQPLPQAWRDRAAAAHVGRSGTVVLPGKYHSYPEMAAAGLWTTPSDLARFAIAVQRARVGDEGAIVKAGTVTSMLGGVARVDDDRRMGLGLFLCGKGDALRFEHGGANAGFRCFLQATASTGQGAVVMTNSDRGGRIVRSVVQRIAASYRWPPATRTDAIDTLCASMTKPGHPGVAVAVISKGKMMLSKGYGEANLEYGLPITSQTVFHVASVSKQFTSFAVALLEADGKLTFGDDVRKHLAYVPDFGKTITLRHLATHTSGLRDQWQLLGIAGWRLDDVITTEHILDMVRHQKELNFAPGARHLYSNTGYTLLAEVVRKVSGRSLAEFLKERVFDPLGMKGAHVHDDHERIVPDRAYSYRRDGTGWRKAVLSLANAGATSLFATAEDLALWLHNFSMAKVGGRVVVDRLFERGKTVGGQPLAYALGIVHGEHEGLALIGHGGSDAGFRSNVIWFPEKELGVVVLGNYSAAGPGVLARRIASVWLGKELPRAKPTAQARMRRSFVSRRRMRVYIGRYRMAGGLAVRVFRDKRKLCAQADGAAALELMPVKDHEFIGLPARVRVIFDVADDRATGMRIFHRNGRKQRADRVAAEGKQGPDFTEFAGAFYSDELDTTYRLVVEDGKLVARHRRHGRISLLPLGQDRFGSRSWFFGSIVMTRDDAGKVDGFRLSGGRVLHLRFRKRTE
ncbi:MAG: serine hydrolase [Planctomycetota bacterium]|nr:serine hydrolase [Planctomycetota bacterium]